MTKKETKMKRDTRINVKYVHVTLQKVINSCHDYWLQLAKSFRENVQAVLVGVEENHAEGKGMHVHVIIQFTTRLKLNREHFIKHFGSDSLHIATKKDKNALLMGLGYVSKTGNTKQFGTFTHRGIELDADPAVYKFQYQVKSVDDAIAYYQKVIKESITSKNDLIVELADSDNAIGRYLVARPTLMRALVRQEHAWKLNHRNSQKHGFKFADFVHDRALLEQNYSTYLSDFPAIFVKHLPKLAEYKLENDFEDHIDHDLAALQKIITCIEEATEVSYNRVHKSMNLYIWSSKPSFGKTRLLNFVVDNMKAYRLPDDQYYVDYRNNYYDVLISDEAAQFIKSKSYSHLKHIFEGQRVEFNRKQKEKVMKLDNPLLILAENISFNDLMTRTFPKVYNQEVMASRVLDLEIKSRATIHFLIDKCVIKAAE